ncbi:MAG TPA: DUF4169 family protein [Rhizomicrobium sp.]|jgi:hypothetical protein
MGDIVNLRRAKKAKAREDTQKQADANRAKHGTPKASRTASDAENKRAARAVDAHRREQE